jgi:hypothetical protein
MGKKIMALKPISYYGQFTPTGVDQSGARRMQALAGLGETVAGLGTKFSIDKAEREAPAQALQAVEEARTVDEEGKVSYGDIEQRRGYGANVFQNTVINAQLSQRNTDSKVRLIELATEFADDPAGYENASKAYFDATINSAPIELRQDLIAAIAPRIATATANISKAFEVSTQNQSIDTLSNGVDVGVIDIEKLARNGDADLVSKEKEILFAEMDALAEVSPKYASDLEAEKRKVERSIILQTEIGNVDRAIFNEDLSNEEKLISGAKFLEDFRTSEIEGVSPTEKDQMLGLISQRLNGVKKEYDKEVTQNKKDIGMARVENALNEVEPIGNEPIIPITQADANNYYAEVYLQTLPSDPLLRGAYQAEFVARTTFIPKALKQELTNDLRSNDPVKIQAASDTMSRIQEIAGIGQNAFTATESAFANQVNFHSQYNADPSDAIKIAQANTDPANTARIEARTAEIKSKEGKKVFAESYTPDIVAAYGQGFWNKEIGVNQIQKDQIVSDYGKLVEANWVAGFETIDQAKENAMLQIQANWKQSEFGFMRNRPEDFYGIGLENDTSYMRDDLHEVLNSAFKDQDITIDKDAIYLVSDGITARQASVGKPTYRVMFRSSDGSLQSFAGVSVDGVDFTRYDPSDIMPAVKEQRAREIKAQAKADLKGSSSVASVDIDAMLENSGLDLDKREQMRKTLQNSTNPFALIGKAISYLDELPEAIVSGTSKTMDILTPKTGPVIGKRFGGISPALTQASDNYIEKLKSSNKDAK